MSVYVLVTKITSPESIKIEVKHTQNRGFASASWVLYSSRDKSHAIKLCNICSPSSNKIEVLHSEYRGSGSGPPNCSISCDMPRAIKLCNICSPSNYKSRFCTQSIEDLAADLLIALFHVTCHVLSNYVIYVVQVTINRGFALRVSRIWQWIS